MSKILGKITFSAKVVQSCLRREDSASRTEALGNLPLAKGFLKPLWDCVSQGYRIVSAYAEKREERMKNVVLKRRGN